MRSLGSDRLIDGLRCPSSRSPYDKLSLSLSIDDNDAFDGDDKHTDIDDDAHALWNRIDEQSIIMGVYYTDV